MSPAARRCRTAVRVVVWGGGAAWLAPHVARQDGAWLVALVGALALVTVGALERAR